MDWSFTNALKLSYWFALSTPPLKRTSFIVALVGLGVFFAVGVALRVMAGKRRSNPPLARGLRRSARPFFFFSLLGVVLVFFRQLGALILSARFWMAFILAITVAWLVWILRTFLKSYKIERARLEQERKYREYLPKRK